MMTKRVKAIVKKKSQVERVYDYLLKKGKLGATNFEMMVTLKICDIRKRISELREGLVEYWIDSEFEESKEGNPHKRYWLIPAKFESLAEFLYETKRTRKVTRQSTGGGRR